MNDSNKNEYYMLEWQRNIKKGLCNIDENQNWLDIYEEWKNRDVNQFNSLLTITDPFDLSCAGDNYSYDNNDLKNMSDLDVLKMSVFLSEYLQQLCHKTFLLVNGERIREKKLNYIEHYFSIINKIISCPELSGCFISLKEAADKQAVLMGERSVDLYVKFFSLQEILGKKSTESLYLLFVYWRISRNKKDLKRLISSLIDYIQTYFYDFEHDTDMHLYHPLDGLLITKKLDLIVHWLEMVAFHTNGIFEKYKDLKWLNPKDQLVDDVTSANRISKYEMQQYKIVFAQDDNETVKKKAVCNHGYITWIKTVDVMHIVCDIYFVLYNFSDYDLNKLYMTKTSVLEQFDNMTKIKNYYTGKVFFHQVYYQLERKYFDSQVMEALEKDADLFNESIDDILKFVEAISFDDIEGLMQAKQNYIMRLKDFTTTEQQDKLDKLVIKITEKIRQEVSKKDIYENLYASVSSEFESYLTTLAKIPNIFCSLVSAEYLYNQYVDNQKPRERFDYSCISIMYYMSLEDFLNKLVYIPYYNEVLKKLDANESDFDWNKYVSNNKKFFKKGKVIKTTCEIGVFGHLFENIFSEDCLQQFLYDRYKITDMNLIKQYGLKLKDKAPRRNDAAHGGNYLSYQDVCEDKCNVFNAVNDYRGMILELLDMLFSS